MDRTEYRIRRDEIASLCKKRKYAEAADIADTIDWRQEKNPVFLCKVSEIYKINRRLEDSHDILLMANAMTPGKRNILYSLCELEIAMGDIVQALRTYNEFVGVAPKSTGRYKLQYKLYQMQGVSLEEQIEVLEKLKNAEYTDRWGYELASLYQKVGRATECVAECDQLFTWFHDGKWVVRALELKQMHALLTEEQRDVYRSAMGNLAEINAQPTIEEGREHVEIDRATAKMGVEAVQEIEAAARRSKGYETPGTTAYAPEPEKPYVPVSNFADEMGNPQGTDYPQEYGAVQGNGYSQENAYAQGSSYTQGGYPQESSYAQGAGYPQEGSYAQQGFYPQEGNYALGAGYSEENGYAQSGSYGQESGMLQTDASYPMNGYIHNGVFVPEAAEAPSYEQEPYQGATYPETSGTYESPYGEPQIPYTGYGDPAFSESQPIPGMADEPMYEPAQEPTREVFGTEEQSFPEEIMVPTPDYNDQFNTINLQEALAENMKQVMEEPPVQGATPGQTRVFTEEDQAQILQGIGAFQEPTVQEAPQPEMDVQDVSHQQTAGTGAVPGMETRVYEAVSAPEGQGVRNFVPQITQPLNYDTRQIYQEYPLDNEQPGSVIRPMQPKEPSQYDSLLTQEGDGQLSMVLPTENTVEKQITGQISIADIMNGLKQEQLSRQKKEMQERILQETDTLFSQFDDEEKKSLQSTIARVVEDTVFGEKNNEPVSHFNGSVITPEGGPKPYVLHLSQDLTRKAEPEAPVEETATEEEVAEDLIPEVDETAEVADATIEDAAVGADTEGAVETEEAAIESEAVAKEVDDTEDDETDSSKENEDAAESVEEAAEAESEAKEESEEKEESGAEADSEEKEEDDSEKTDDAEAEAEAETTENAETEVESEEKAEAETEKESEEEAAETEAKAESEEEESEVEAAEDSEEEDTEAESESEDGEDAETETASEEEEDSETEESVEESDDGDTIEETDEEKDAAEEDDSAEETSSQEAAEDSNTAAEASAPTKKQRVNSRDIRDDNRVRVMTPEEKELFGPYIHHRKSRRQIIHAIDSLTMDASKNNVIVTGAEGAGTVNLAKGLIQSAQAGEIGLTGKVAKITAESLNHRDVENILDKIPDGALIIEQAADLESDTIASLEKDLRSKKRKMIIIMEDINADMNRMLKRNPTLKEIFNVRVDIEALDNEALVKYAKQYALDREYAIDDLGVLALHTRIGALQTIDHEVTISEVREMVDEAIDSAESFSLGHVFDVFFQKRYDENDMIILREKDFAE